MRILVYGNSGSGKSFLAKRLARERVLEHLDLDTLVWEPGKIAVPRPAADVVRDLERFLDSRERWVIEGCYGELVERAASRCTELVFLDPGLETCLANNRARPWEPHKYASADAQRSMLPALLAWVAEYYARDGSWSHAAHRRIFDGFAGAKRRVTRLDDA